MKSIPLLPSKQCVILIGGLGSRLGDAVKNTPKPMLEVAGKPFLVHLIEEISRFGFTDFILLAGYKAEVVKDYFAAYQAINPKLKIKVIVEQSPLGTAGALLMAKDILADCFLLCNGDSFFDCNLLKIAIPFADKETLMRMALKPVQQNSRYGHVLCAGKNVVSFAERDEKLGKGLMNAGIYYVNKEILQQIKHSPCSLESDIFPKLANAGKIEQHTFPDAYFIDIGIPDDFAKACNTIGSALSRPAAFFDRDGVLNHNYGHVHAIKDFVWMQNAKEAILACNDAGYFVFVVTNQAGIAKGLYAEKDMHILHNFMQTELSKIGAHIDVFAFCPHHPEGIVPELRQICTCRKPEAGMILELFKKWPVKKEKSFLIGDKESDLLAAHKADIKALLFSEGSLLHKVHSIL